MVEYLLEHWIAVLAVGISGMTFLVSLLAIGISVFNLYKTTLEPFTLEVRDGGRVELGMHPGRFPLREFVFSVDLGFSNSGIEAGAVEDVALHVTVPDGREMVFRSYLEHQSRRIKSFELPPPPPAVPRPRAHR